MLDSIAAIDKGAPLDTNVALVDTHCHLEAAAFAGEPTAALLARARKAGVTRVVTIGTNLETSTGAVRVARIHSDVWATVGIDPNDLEDWHVDKLDDLRTLAAAPRVVAIGEIGLDYYWDRAPRSLQQSAFEAQLDLASEMDLPVVIHSRDSDEDARRTLLSWANSLPRREKPRGVMHSYAGDVDGAWPLVEAGFLISLSGIVTFRNNENAPAVARQLPLESLVLETDAPYLAPHPHRGQRNEPAMVRLIAEHVAAVREQSLTEIGLATSANAARLFGLEER